MFDMLVQQPVVVVGNVPLDLAAEGDRQVHQRAGGVPGDGGMLVTWLRCLAQWGLGI